MTFPDVVIDELARAWKKIHGPAARWHLEHMIHQMELGGDDEGAANYNRVLAALIAASARAPAPGHSTKHTSRHVTDAPDEPDSRPDDGHRLPRRRAKG